MLIKCFFRRIFSQTIKCKSIFQIDKVLLHDPVDYRVCNKNVPLLVDIRQPDNKPVRGSLCPCWLVLKCFFFQGFSGKRPFCAPEQICWHFVVLGVPKWIASSSFRRESRQRSSMFSKGISLGISRDSFNEYPDKTIHSFGGVILGYRKCDQAQ